ncbi:MAG TPA: regulatory protein RecX [Ktedonobacteraceae bacterium]|nr:regulatory protein RecX [Ktedonobacteraceae bacterium]
MWYIRSMKITAIETQARDAERVNIYVDGRFLLGASAEVVARLELEVEQELEPEQLEQLHGEEELQRAVERAYNFLSYRPRSRVEVRRYLKRKETPPAIIEAALAKLDRLNLTNDEAFTTFWIENRAQFSPRGERALKNELRQKGVERDIVDELVDDGQDEELALRAGRKKAQSLARLPGMDLATFRTRLGSFLQRRGFGYAVVSRAVRMLWEETQERESTDE